MILRLPVGFAAAFFTIVIPFWRIPYNQFDLGHTELLPGVILLATVTMMLVVAESAQTRWIACLMLLCVPAIDVVAIVRDTAADPTTHNLAPFELVMAVILGAVFVLPGLLVGVLLRA